MKVNINHVIKGLEVLEQQYNNESSDNASIAVGALNQLDYRMYEIEQIGVDFEDFCEATKISEDELNEAMGGEVI
jgi:hypothetical protein